MEEWFYSDGLGAHVFGDGFSGGVSFSFFFLELVVLSLWLIVDGDLEWLDLLLLVGEGREEGEGGLEGGGIGEMRCVVCLLAMENEEVLMSVVDLL